MTQKPDWRPVCSLADLDTSPVHSVVVASTTLVVVKSGERVRILSGICPHDHAPLGEGHLEQGLLICPRHRARFDLDSGAAAEGFVLPCLKRYPARTRNGVVEVDQRAVAEDPSAPATERWDLTRPSAGSPEAEST